MAKNSIVLSAVKIHADNKKLEVDDKGYYKVILGAINSFNSSNDFYLLDGVEDLVKNDSSSLRRRIEAGYLKGEAGHPVFQPGMNKADFFTRNLRIHLPLVSHQIREVILTPSTEPSGISGKGNVIIVEGWVKPSGPLGDALKKDLDDPDTNVAFSIRCITQDEVVGGINTKKIVQIITWDWVVEPGISLANKWKKLSMENLDMMSMDVSDLFPNGGINECINCSLESGEEKNMLSDIKIAVEQNIKKKTNVLLNW